MFEIVRQDLHERPHLAPTNRLKAVYSTDDLAEQLRDEAVNHTRGRWRKRLRPYNFLTVLGEVHDSIQTVNVANLPFLLPVGKVEAQSVVASPYRANIETYNEIASFLHPRDVKNAPYERLISLFGISAGNDGKCERYDVAYKAIGSAVQTITSLDWGAERSTHRIACGFSVRYGSAFGESLRLEDEQFHISQGGEGASETLAFEKGVLAYTRTEAGSGVTAMYGADGRVHRTFSQRVTSHGIPERVSTPEAILAAAVARVGEPMNIGELLRMERVV